MNYSRILEVHDSAMIAKIGYDWESKTLRVWFVDDNIVWDYYNVYPTDFAKLCAADSVGSAFNSRIKTRFEGKKIDNTTEGIEPQVQAQSSTQETEVGSTAKKEVVLRESKCFS